MNFLQRRRMSCRRVFIFAIFCHILVLSKSAEKLELPEPEVCSRYADICGEDLTKYPARGINTIIDKASERHNKLTLDRFFGLDPPFKIGFVNFADEKFRSTCDFRNEKLPRYPRVKNVRGEYVYIGQRSDKEQIIKIVYCANPDEPCKIDSDSPMGAGSTVCKQLFRTYKMLAVRPSGELVVDTFKLPSACVCHYVEPTWGLRSGLDALLSPEKSDQSVGPTCSAHNSAHELGDNDGVNFQSPRNVPKLGGRDVKITPCVKGKIICDLSDWEYSVDKIDTLVSTHIAFKSPVLFEKLFGDVCSADGEEEISTRTLFDPNLINLCASASKYFYPRKIQALNRRWFLIVNTERYRQGVTIDECLESSMNKPCKYGGAEGVDPEVKSKCLQVYSLQYFLVINEIGDLSYEVFRVPTTCSCYTEH